MSDIAVTWAKAQTCPSIPKNKGRGEHRPVPDRNAKQVLVHLASYADAEGIAWALVDVLALEMDVSVRTVQRGLEALRHAGLIWATGDEKSHKGRLVPYYQLRLDEGPANTRQRMRSMETAAPGVTGDTPSQPQSRHQCHPTGVTGDIATGVTGDTQIGKGITQGLTPSAGACATAVSLWAEKAPERVSPVRVAASWAAALERTGLDEAALLAAVVEAVKRDPDFGRDRAMNLHRWLDEDRFRMWLAERTRDAGQARRTWDGPEAVRDAVVAAMGESGAVAYVDPARWDEAARAVVARTATAARRLRDGAAKALKALNVRIECEVVRG
mgnify:CR=1 FL=1